MFQVVGKHYLGHLHGLVFHSQYAGKWMIEYVMKRLNNSCTTNDTFSGKKVNSLIAFNRNQLMLEK